ncbi:uncharacterized protein LOC133524486 isoform X1 [Cydia pomonella]|uniref:uncharacterized protein LOC133524486 isoform X1 n=1 Tax=Cydia pomonella TaxID=82600 RepID=UPI002ADDAE20|nr:uncharacterized protein LOC133524486 isoform X1 [Cydia pomonella]
MSGRKFRRKYYQFYSVRFIIVFLFTMSQKRNRSNSWDEEEKISQEDATVATPIAKKVDSIPAKDAKRKSVTNNMVHSCKKPRKVNCCLFRVNFVYNTINKAIYMSLQDHEDYINNMLGHSKMLKDDEHVRKMEIADEEHKIKMEMAVEEHKIKMEIHRERLQSAILEREILELKKAREVLNP